MKTQESPGLKPLKPLCVKDHPLVQQRVAAVRAAKERYAPLYRACPRAFPLPLKILAGLVLPGDEPVLRIFQ